MMEPQVKDAPDRSRFEIFSEGALAGVAEYRRSAGTIAFTHTEVDPDMAGRGLGGALTRAALDAAARQELAVLPYCPFVRDWIARHPGYVRLVPSARRAHFGL